MAKKNKLIPFSALPFTWGMAGKTREIAQAEYELDGFDLEEKLIEIERDTLDNDTYVKKTWDLQLKYNKITKEEYHRKLIDLIKDDKQKALAELELDFREGNVTELEYQKNTASIKGEPWVTVLSMDFGGKSALEGSFELDWNEQFVDKLRAEGYTGPTPDIIVNQWFMEVCRNIAMEEFDGTGDFAADSEANLDAVKRWSAGTKSMENGRKAHR